MIFLRLLHGLNVFTAILACSFKNEKKGFSSHFRVSYPKILEYTLSLLQF